MTKRHRARPDYWRNRAATHQRALCAGRDRRPGSAENLASTTYVAEVLARTGWVVTQLEFGVVLWEGVEEHRRLIAVLEAGRPTAIVAATGRCPEMAGALSPFPFVEDGDFPIPAGYVDEQVGSALVAYEALPARIVLNGQRQPAIARNVVGRRASQKGRVTVPAHVDTKVGTPGALDNAAGVTVVLLLAELLDRSTPTGVVFLVVNGEDYYNAAGEVRYLDEHDGNFEDVALAVNLDGSGYREGRTAYSLYGCDDPLAAHVRRVIGGHRLVEGPQWWQSDHAIFAMRGRPAVALTSEHVETVSRTVLHSANDTVEQVDPALLVQAAEPLAELIEQVPLAGRGRRS